MDLSGDGMAAVNAALGWGASTMDGLAALITGNATFVSIWMGLISGLGSGLGITILGCSSLTSSLGGLRRLDLGWLGQLDLGRRWWRGGDNQNCLLILVCHQLLDLAPDIKGN